MYIAFKKVFGTGRYAFAALSLFVAIIVAVLLFPNRSLVLGLYGDAGLIPAAHVAVLLLGSLVTNMSIFSIIGLIVTALLFSVNVTLFVYYIRRRYTHGPKRPGVSGTFGFIIGLFGVGCASCGSLLFASLLSAVGLGSLLSFLPFGGEELILLGIIFLLFSIYELLKKIRDPLVCRI